MQQGRPKKGFWIIIGILFCAILFLAGLLAPLFIAGLLHYGKQSSYLVAMDFIAIGMAAAIAISYKISRVIAIQVSPEKAIFSQIIILGCALILFTVNLIIIFAFTSQPGPETHDSRMLSNARMIASGLELYHNDLGDYPTDLQMLTPKYIGLLPETYSKDSVECTVKQNSYTYIRQNPNDYKLTFCFNKTTGGYKKGIHSMTASGMQ